MADCLVVGPSLVPAPTGASSVHGIETTNEITERELPLRRRGNANDQPICNLEGQQAVQAEQQIFEPQVDRREEPIASREQNGIHEERQIQTSTEQIAEAELAEAEEISTDSELFHTALEQQEAVIERKSAVEQQYSPQQSVPEQQESPLEEQRPGAQEGVIEQQELTSEQQEVLGSSATQKESESEKQAEEQISEAEKQKFEQEEVEVMEGETAIQTQSPLPSMEELQISEAADQGQTTVPRVPDLSGKGEATLATQESLEDLSSGGSEGMNGSETGNGISDQASPFPTGTPGGGTTVSATQNSTAKESSSKSSGGKSKRKEDKAIEHILKALNSLDTTEEKLAALCKKYADLHEDHRVQQASFKQTQKKLQVTSREKDQLQSEHNKAVMAKGKLESLCRELQKHNKLIKEESLARAREEEERRKEVSAKFQSTIAEIQTQMQDNHERNIKLKEENVELGHKLKSLVEQYEAREEHIEKLMKHRDLETQLHEAKMQQAQCLLAKEQEQNRKEREMVLLTMTEAKKKSDLHEAQEKQLRSQLAMYTEKYDEFQSTLNKSNEVFGKFKTEMDKMTKRIKKLEKETAMWRGKWETSNKALLEMAEEKQKHDKEKAVFRAKIDKLESLCRALQAERRGKAENIPEVKLECTEAEKEKNFDPTKTPPNTPDAPSRTSPETVQGAADGEGNGQAESGEVGGANTTPDHHGSAQVQENTQPSALHPAVDPPQEVLASQSDDTGAAQLSQSELDMNPSNNQSNDTAAAPANQPEPPVTDPIPDQSN